MGSAFSCYQCIVSVSMPRFSLTTMTGMLSRFWKFLLRRNLPRDSLSAVQVAVFGLGDSSYPKFNYVAKKLQKRLEQLGATVLLGLGLADDQHEMGVDGALVRVYGVGWVCGVAGCNVRTMPKVLLYNASQ